MTDTTAARRALLDILLDRIERGALLDNERDLLRPLVAAEMADADRAEQAEDLLHIAQETSNRAESIVYRLRQAVREARAAARPRSELAGFVEQMTAILDTPSDDEPTPGDGPSPTPGDAPATPVPDALRAGQPVTVGHLEELADAGISVCSPLVNASCPGHTGPPYCDRAPSSPITPAATPDWSQADPEPRTYRLTADGNPIERTVVVPAADTPTTAPDDDPADGSSGTPILDGMLAGYRAQHPADDGPSLGACRVMPTRNCPEFHNGPCGDRPCARFESDDPAPWTGDDTPSEPQQ